MLILPINAELQSCNENGALLPERKAGVGCSKGGSSFVRNPGARAEKIGRNGPTGLKGQRTQSVRKARWAGALYGGREPSCRVGKP
jgi:hypothetical protein